MKLESGSEDRGTRGWELMGRLLQQEIIAYGTAELLLVFRAVLHSGE